MLIFLKKEFRSYRGRNFFSRWGRKIFEKGNIRGILGVNLILAVTFAGFLSSPASALDNLEGKAVPLESPKIVTTTESFWFFPTEGKISQRFSSSHPGWDIAAPYDTPIYPLSEGIVERIIYDTNTPLGFHLIIDHGQGFKTLYGHLSQIRVKSQDKVDKETIIGQVGNTGRATGSHLHFEVWQDGQPLNPLEVLPER